MYKVIGVSNFDREDMSDILIKENIEFLPHAEHAASEWNKHNSGPSAPRYARVVPQDKPLYVFEGY